MKNYFVTIDYLSKSLTVPDVDLVEDHLFWTVIGIVDVERSAWYPFSLSSFTSSEPKYPEPPVTSTFMLDLVDKFLPSFVEFPPPGKLQVHILVHFWQG